VGDRALQEIAADIGMTDQFMPTHVSVYFGEPEVTVTDPYFGGRGPDRTGCNFCGGCMTGCRYGSKNTLDRNYLHLARQEGAVLQSESEVCDVRPLGAPDGSDGYEIVWKSATSWSRKQGTTTTRGVVFAGGALGSVRLLLEMKETSLPRLSDMVGRSVRTNSESLIGVTTFDRRTAFSEGVSIGSILHTDEVSHVEPVRYAAGSGFWRLQMSPLVHGRTAFSRVAKAVWDLIRHPIANLRVLFVWDWSRRTQILLFMRTIESRFRFSKGRLRLKSSLDSGLAPTAFIPEAKDLAERFAEKVHGKPMVLLSETVLGIPTTAHILGGAVMGQDAGEGVIDRDNRVFGYQNMYVCDGSVITANPGVNPALTIAALSERAMSRIPARDEASGAPG
jgi:cholesterol oxidase